MTIELSVVTITYNERENIRLFVEEVQRQFAENKISGEIIIVDDASPDQTAEVVHELQQKYPQITLIQRSGKLGIGSAYRRGIETSTGTVIALLDADLSHPPTYLPAFLQRAREGHIVFGSRYLGKTTFDTDLPHRLGTRLLNTWASALLRTQIRDHTNGYIVIARDVLNSVMVYGKSRQLDPFNHILYGITIAAIARKLSIKTLEQKAPYTKRRHGETKIPFWWGVRVVLGDMVRCVKLRSKLR